MGGDCSTESPGQTEDLRGLGSETIGGKKVRKYSGSTRPPHIDPMIWSKWNSKSDEEKAVAEYVSTLNNSDANPAAPAAGGQPQDYRTMH